MSKLSSPSRSPILSVLMSRRGNVKPPRSQFRRLSHASNPAARAQVNISHSYLICCDVKVTWLRRLSAKRYLEILLMMSRPGLCLRPSLPSRASGLVSMRGSAQTSGCPGHLTIPSRGGSTRTWPTLCVLTPTRGNVKSPRGQSRALP